MINKPLKSKHSQNNRESREGQVLRFIREARKLSLKEVGTMLGFREIDIDHFENGRRFYTTEEIEKFLQCYHLSQEHFTSLMNLKLLNKQLVNHYLLKL